jgi:hypothetical protein
VSDAVGMLDRVDKTLHRPGHVHLTTACGLPLDFATVGPLSVTAARALRCCPECFDELDELLPALAAFDERSNP